MGSQLLYFEVGALLLGQGLFLVEGRYSLGNRFPLYCSIFVTLIYKYNFGFLSIGPTCRIREERMPAKGSNMEKQPNVAAMEARLYTLEEMVKGFRDQTQADFRMMMEEMKMLISGSCLKGKEKKPSENFKSHHGRA